MSGGLSYVHRGGPAPAGLAWCARARRAAGRPTVEAWRVIRPEVANGAAMIWELYR